MSTSDLSEIRAVLMRLDRSIGKIEGTLEAISDGLDRGSKRMDDHDIRIRSVESDRSQSAGKASILGLGAGFVAGLILEVATWIGKRV